MGDTCAPAFSPLRSQSTGYADSVTPFIIIPTLPQEAQGETSSIGRVTLKLDLVPLGKATYLHIGEVIDGVDMRAEVGLLSRNVVVMGEMEGQCYEYGSKLCSFFDFDTFGGHIKVRLEPSPCTFLLPAAPSHTEEARKQEGRNPSCQPLSKQPLPTVHQITPTAAACPLALKCTSCPCRHCSTRQAGAQPTRDTVSMSQPQFSADSGGAQPGSLI